MREPSFLVLAALAAGPRHGYAVMQEVAEMSGGRVKLRPGTLYAALDRQCREGLVAEAGEQVIDGRHRRYYELTDEGATALAGEVARMRADVREATKRLAMRPATT
jgi:PadR family transcriptional regulator PadR